MQSNTNPEAVSLMQGAKAQAREIDVLLQHSELTNDTAVYKEMQAAAHSVVDCVLEGLNLSRPEQFQKNFLVIAKAINAELQAFLQVALDENCFSVEKHNALLAANKHLHDELVSFVKYLRDSATSKDMQTTTPKK